MSHFEEEALFEEEIETSPDAGEIEPHASACEDCTSGIGEQLIAALADAEVWEDRPPVSPAPRQAVRSVAMFVEQARREDQLAEALCDEILTGPSTWWPQKLRKAEGAFTAGMVKQLLERMRPMVVSSPANALQVTALALDVANALDVVAYPCDYVIKLRAQALRDHAYVLMIMGRFPEALECADRSKRLFDQVPLPDYDLARLSLVKALILQYVDRTDEAAELARSAGDTFLRFGDRAKYLDARQTEGSVLYFAQSFERALATWRSIENDPALDDHSSVRVTHNIALCLSELGRATEAIEALNRCVAQFELLGMETHRTRGRAVLAYTLLNAGRPAEAIPIYRIVSREFEQLDMVADAGLASLDLVEALLATNQFEEVPAICRNVIALFTRTGMASRAITALSFLREAVAIGHASPSIVRHVREFLRKLPAEQPRLFAKPPAGLGE